MGQDQVMDLVDIHTSLTEMRDRVGSTINEDHPLTVTNEQVRVFMTLRRDCVGRSQDDDFPHFIPSIK